MTTINTHVFSPVSSNKNILDMSALGNLEGMSATGSAPKAISLQNLPQLFADVTTEKPVLTTSTLETTPEQLSAALGELDAQKLSSASQSVNMTAVSGLVQEMLSLVENDSIEQKTTTSVDAAKNSEFVGISSSDIISELTKLLRKVAAAINTSDRQINAMFLQLSAKMVEAAAASTIKEGKEMMTGALINFGVSLGVSGMSASFQGRSLHKQNKSITNNLSTGTQNMNAGSRMSSLNGQASALSGKSNSSVLKGKEGLSIELTDQGTSAQKLAVGQNGQKAADSTKAHGQNQLNEHNRIVNNESVKRGVAEQAGRLSDQAGNMAAAPSQADAKEASANAMREQETAQAARKVSDNSEKTIGENGEHLKKMNEALEAMRDSNIRTFQSVARG